MANTSRRAQSSGQLNSRNTQPTDAENCHRFAGTEPSLVQGMQRRGRRAHQNRALFERNFVRQAKDAALGYKDEFSVTAVAMLSDHLGGAAKLFSSGLAESALAAGHQVMHADAITFGQTLDVRAGFFHHPRNLVTERERQWLHRRNSRAVVRIRMANARGLYPDQDIARADLRECNVLRLEG